MTASRPHTSSRAVPLVTAGEFFLDLIFYDLQELPDFGEELKTENFAFTFGGGAAITAAAAARLGRSSQLITAWGDSALDTAARTRLSELGLGINRSLICPGRLPGLTVSVSTRRDRFFLTAPGANSEIEAFLLSSDFAQSVEPGCHLHFALTPRSWQPFQQQVTQLQKRGITVSWDMGWDPEAASAPGFLALCRQLDLLFLNDKEACRYSGLDEPMQAAEWFRGEQKAVVIKCGRKGSSALTHSAEWIEAPALAVDAVDSTGAGDAFNGGFLHLWLQREDLLQCLYSGNVCGALSTRRAGGIDGLPDLASHEQGLRQLSGND